MASIIPQEKQFNTAKKLFFNLCQKKNQQIPSNNQRTASKAIKYYFLVLIEQKRQLIDELVQFVELYSSIIRAIKIIRIFVLLSTFNANFKQHNACSAIQ